MMRMHRAIALALIMAGLLSGCDYLPFGYTAIKEITAAPGTFESKQVKIKGTVTNAIKLPILGQSFTVRDQGGEITVVTNGTLPSIDTEVALTGIVKSAAIVGGQSIGLRVEETKRLR
jgi:cytochrome c-type biogenesis protein CcmE